VLGCTLSGFLVRLTHDSVEQVLAAPRVSVLNSITNAEQPRVVRSHELTVCHGLNASLF
jgi:hypothetical protein